MRIPHPVEPATFLERPNRFVIRARLRGSDAEVSAHCPNPGRMHELMIAGATVYLSAAQDPARRTPFTLRFIEHPANGQLISLNTQLPNDLFAEGLESGFFTPFIDYTNYRREVGLPAAPKGITSRMDFRLRAEDGRVCWIETKSATLVDEDGRAYFPDAPTLRGRRHLQELEHLASSGAQAAVVFIIQRPDALSIAPNRATDPDFADALVQAHARGVELYAYTCGVTTSHVWLEKEVPVLTG